jgi:RNA polymerase sigma-70 factor (ECF subfamily)
VTATPPEDSVATRASLLARIKDWEDQDSWREFFDTYWQLIHRVALKSGLSETEAQDAVQETVVAVAKNIGNFDYDPNRCSFKNWLMLITRQRIVWQLRKRLPCGSDNKPMDSDGPSTSMTDRIPDPSPLDLTAVWDEEWQKNLMAVALESVKEQANPRHFQIFDLCVLQDWTAGEVAQKLQIGVAQVYLAKHRVSAALKKEMKRLEHAANCRPVVAAGESSGFTMTELLVVIATIGILTAFLLPALNRAKATAQFVACKSNLRQIGFGLSMYIEDFKKYPLYWFAILGPNRQTWDNTLLPYCGSDWDHLTISDADGGVHDRRLQQSRCRLVVTLAYSLLTRGYYLRIWRRESLC